MYTLTTRQAQILKLIRRFMERTGIPPTRADLCQALGFASPNAAESHLRALARKGVIELLPGTSRGIRLLIPTGLPVVGEVAAGTPILAEQHIETHYPVGPTLFHPAANYLLRVRGLSMRDAGILDGDLLAVHQTRIAENGQIVVARVDDEVTVKQFHRLGNKVQLVPKNPDFVPIEVDLRQQNLFIEGIGVGVLRNRAPHLSCY